MFLCAFMCKNKRKKEYVPIKQLNDFYHKFDWRFCICMKILSGVIWGLLRAFGEFFVGCFRAFWAILRALT